MDDVIYRQAAIDALHMHIMYRMSTDSNKKRLDEWINNLPSAQPEQRWIPCSERLPEESGRYLISALDGIRRRTTVTPYQPRYKAWTMTGKMAYWKVVAWMPLPEPYKEGEQDD